MRGRLESKYLSKELPVAVLGFSGGSVGKNPLEEVPLALS